MNYHHFALNLERGSSTILEEEIDIASRRESSDILMCEALAACEGSSGRARIMNESPIK
jgi:hypothetical protein